MYPSFQPEGYRSLHENMAGYHPSSATEADSFHDRLNQMRSAEAYYPNEDEFQPLRLKGGQKTLLYVLWFFVFLGFIFCTTVLYYLFNRDSSALRNSCGGMWETLLVRMLFSFVSTVVLVIDYWYPMTWLSLLRGYTGATFFTLYFLVFAILQAFIVPKNLMEKSCHDTLVRVSPTDNNNLEILSWINLVVDWLFAVGLGSYYIIGWCVGCCGGRSS